MKPLNLMIPILFDLLGGPDDTLDVVENDGLKISTVFLAHLAYCLVVE